MLGQLSSCTAAEWNCEGKGFFFMIQRVGKLFFFSLSFGVLLVFVSDFGEEVLPYYGWCCAERPSDAPFSTKQSIPLYLKKHSHDLVSALCKDRQRSTGKKAFATSTNYRNHTPLKGERAFFCAAPAIFCSFSTMVRGILAFQQTGDNSPFPTEKNRRKKKKKKQAQASTYPKYKICNAINIFLTLFFGLFCWLIGQLQLLSRTKRTWLQLPLGAVFFMVP